MKYGKMFKKVTVATLLGITLLGGSGASMGMVANARSFNKHQLQSANHFGHKQITYRIDQNHGGKRYNKIWKTAIKGWNKSVRIKTRRRTYPLFKQAKRNQKADVVLSAVGGSYRWHRASDLGNISRTVKGRWSTVNKHVVARINTRAFAHKHYNFSQRVHVAERQLGHVVGLPTLNDKHSIMNPNVKNQHITKHDKEAVRYILSRI